MGHMAMQQEGILKERKKIHLIVTHGHIHFTNKIIINKTKEK